MLGELRASITRGRSAPGRPAAAGRSQQAADTRGRDDSSASPAGRTRRPAPMKGERAIEISSMRTRRFSALGLLSPAAYVLLMTVAEIRRKRP